MALAQTKNQAAAGLAVTSHWDLWWNPCAHPVVPLVYLGSRGLSHEMGVLEPLPEGRMRLVQCWYHARQGRMSWKGMSPAALRPPEFAGSR